jgi:hypothetical protein
MGRICFVIVRGRSGMTTSVLVGEDL